MLSLFILTLASGFIIFVLMKIIRSSGNNPVDIIVDDDVYLWASKIKWSISSRLGHRVGYARTRHSLNGKKIDLFLHRMVMGEPDGMVVDHIDHDPYNCQRSNLRTCTPAQNACNVSPNRTRASKYLGVVWNKKNRIWISQIKHSGKYHYLGSYISEIDAAVVYNQEAAKLRGQFTTLNVI